MKSAERESTLERYGLLSGLVMLAIWLIGMVLMNPAPGWLHFFLIFGVFMVIYGIVVRGGRNPDTPGKSV